MYTYMHMCMCTYIWQRARYGGSGLPSHTSVSQTLYFSHLRIPVTGFRAHTHPGQPTKMLTFIVWAETLLPKTVTALGSRTWYWTFPFNWTFPPPQESFGPITQEECASHPLCPSLMISCCPAGLLSAAVDGA